MDPLQIGYTHLNDFQKAVVKECLERKFGSLSTALGSGKTLMALVLSLQLTQLTQDPILFIMSKSLLKSWEYEIKKFFGDQLKYKVIHSEYMDCSQFKLRTKYPLYLTTVDCIAKAYKQNNINLNFIDQRFIAHARQLGHYENFYIAPKEPYLRHIKGMGVFYSVKWGAVMVDEAQNFTNITTIKCQGIGALAASHRWLLSGTIFSEPKPERILGYHMMLHAPEPNSLPDTITLLKSNDFKGLNEYQVIREKNEAFTKEIAIRDSIISHPLNREEEKIYCMMRSILIQVQRKAKEAKLLSNKIEQKIFNNYILVMIMYLRQAVIHPLIPITSIIIDSSNLAKRSELSRIILSELHKLNMDAYLNDTQSVISSRLKSVLDTVDVYPNQVIMYSCHTTCLELLHYLLLQRYQRPVFLMTSKMTMEQRGALLNKFKQTKDGCLLLTFELGAEGHNLQTANTVMIIDFWWNAAKTKQSIGRILRYGQLADTVNIVFFTASTAIEQVIFEKQKMKMQILQELKYGKSDTIVPKMSMNQVVKIIELEHNKTSLQQIKHF